MQAFQREIHIDGEIYIALFSSLHMLVYSIRLYLEHIFGRIEEGKYSNLPYLWSIRLIIEECTPFPFLVFRLWSAVPPGYTGPHFARTFVSRILITSGSGFPYSRGEQCSKKTFPFSIDFYGKKSSFDPNISNIMHNRSKITSDSGGTH